MCDPKPGARCSADTAKELATARRRLDQARSELERHPEDQGCIRRAARAETMLAAKQAAYDSAPGGQRELLASIAAAADPNAPGVDELRSRLATGRATRAAQKRALAAARGDDSAAADLEVDRMLNRLRHPDSTVVRDSATPRDALIGFMLPAAANSTTAIRIQHRDSATGDLRPEHVEIFESAELARATARGRGLGSFRDAQTGSLVVDDFADSLDHVN